MLWTIFRVSDLNKPITLIIVLFTQIISQNVLNANTPVISAKSHWRRDLICISRAEYHRCVWGIFDIGLCSLKHSYPDQFKLVAVCVCVAVNRAVISGGVCPCRVMILSAARHRLLNGALSQNNRQPHYPQCNRTAFPHLIRGWEYSQSDRAACCSNDLTANRTATKGEKLGGNKV